MHLDKSSKLDLSHDVLEKGTNIVIFPYVHILNTNFICLGESRNIVLVDFYIVIQ